MDMVLKEGTSVFTASGEEVGKINRFVLEPATNEVTHLVIQKGWLLPEDKVVPIEWVSSATDEKVVLNKDSSDFEQLPPFEETHFIRIDEDTTDTDGYPTYRTTPAYYWYPPHGYLGFPVGYYGWPPTETQRNIPEDTVPIKEGADVISSDGEHVGDIERIHVDPTSNVTTHFLVSEGLLFKERKLVPAHWVNSVEENKVHLYVSSQMLDRLPEYKD